MALNRIGLEENLLELFQTPPGTTEDCASAWASIIEEYVQLVIPVSTTVATARASLETALYAAFTGGNAAADMETAFTAFAASVASGMAPAFTSTPPTSIMGWETSFSTTVATHAEAATKYADLIHNWVILGTAVPSGGGAAVNWS